MFLKIPKKALKTEEPRKGRLNGERITTATGEFGAIEAEWLPIV
jgi:hypothetical protein